MAQRREAAAAKETAALAATLTPRETEVMAAVVKGLMNKQIAGLLGISEITVKLHRGNVMRKMAVRSSPTLCGSPNCWSADHFTCTGQTDAPTLYMCMVSGC
jgi:FixJ family two-component response regulator